MLTFGGGRGGEAETISVTKGTDRPWKWVFSDHHHHVFVVVDDSNVR